MIKNIEFNANNLKPFSDWLKKFIIIDKSLLIEIDQKNNCFIAKSYNDEKSVVKYSKISFLDAGLTSKKTLTEDKLIKLGVYSVQRLMKSFEHFYSNNFTLSISYDELVDTKTYVGTAILIKSDLLKVKIDCSPLSIFSYISDELFFNKIAGTEVMSTLELNNIMIEKINSLCELDKDYKFLEWIIDKNKIYLRGKSFKLEIINTDSPDFILSLYKEQFMKIDSDSYDVIIGNEKIVYKSKNNDTVVVTSMVVKDEKYEESSVDF